ncbi:Succinate dehydrogenase subunit 5 protein [Thalictrum thalictroides]|uniref:Succinate dehydrogenase subunit 5 protein n=1 Tax=Thalictrum thalictroides TaxID=46969 RepID=A0A7J6W7J3_THATH|nr:Succinate dehydrogenase subunit 5 protein [Thalictrum thalictroides]
MEKLSKLRSLLNRSTHYKSYGFFAINNQQLSHGIRHYITPSFSLSPHTISASSSKRVFSDCRLPFGIGVGGIRGFCESVTQLPIIRDSDISTVFKDFMAISWDDLPESVINDAKKALAKNTRDTDGKEVLADVFRAAEAVEEFGGILVSLRMEIDDIIGLSGEKIGPLPDAHAYALDEVYKRYEEYLDAFRPDEEYLRKKVEIELGAKMIHLKMRLSFLDSQWGQLSVLGTSGLSGSYLEQRAP